MIRDSVKNVVKIKLYLRIYVVNFHSWICCQTDEVLEIWEKCKQVFESFNGSTEKFNCRMFKFSLLDTEQIFPRVQMLVSNLLITEVTTLVYIISQKEKVPVNQRTTLNGMINPDVL